MTMHGQNHIKSLNIFAKILRNLEWLRHVEVMHITHEQLQGFGQGGVHYVSEEWSNI